MTDLAEIINYSTKNDRKIKSICAPLTDCLDIPVFTYSFVQADGRFGFLTNCIEFNDYYFSQGLYLLNPYFSHPSLFRSGHILRPCSTDEETQRILSSRFEADHMFLSLQTDGKVMESFVFANTNIDASGGERYISRLDLLTKFGRYFKREAKDLIGRMRSDQYNIEKARGTEFHQVPSSIPLINHDPQILKFLKTVTGLSRQEQRCLELFKQGKSAQATAAVMGLSQRTVESYFESIKNKLGCASKYDLLEY